MAFELFSQDEYNGRLNKIRAAMQHHDLDCLYLPYGSNQYYLTGLLAQSTAQAASRVLATLVPLTGDIIFVVPSRRHKFVEKMSWVKTIRTWTFPEDPAVAVCAALSSIGAEDGIIGMDPTTPYEEVESIQRLLPNVHFRSCSDIFQRVRLIKSEEEILQIRRAGEIADKALGDVQTVIKEGVKEADIAAKIYSSLLDSGCEVTRVAVIVGKHPGFPEKTGQRHVEKNQLIMMFPKFTYNGYFVDITRMAMVGEPSSEERMIESAIIDSHNAASSIVKPGVTYDQVDQVGRAVLEEFGLAKFFTHGIGHGLGIDTHEPPYTRTNAILEAGMVFTIEPSIYRPGQPAMRVEDTFVVTENGCDRLTNLPINIFKL